MLHLRRDSCNPLKGRVGKRPLLMQKSKVLHQHTYSSTMRIAYLRLSKIVPNSVSRQSKSKFRSVTLTLFGGGL